MGSCTYSNRETSYPEKTAVINKYQTEKRGYWNKIFKLLSTVGGPKNSQEFTLSIIEGICFILSEQMFRGKFWKVRNWKLHGPAFQRNILEHWYISQFQKGMVQKYLILKLSVLCQEWQARISFQDTKALITDANIKESFRYVIPI